MALMFIISGLFVWKSLQRKGAAGYMKDRLIRLGIPVVIAVPILIPLAYYPAQLTAEMVYGGETTYLQFWWGMVSSGFRTAGPLWFLWLLLVFDALVSIFYRLWGTRSSAQSQAHAEQSPGLLSRLLNRPLPLLLVLFVLSAVAYLLTASFIPSYEWVGVGPFVAQGSRLLFYFVYFSLGVLLGAYGLERGLVSERGPLSRFWWLFLPLGVVAWGALVVVVISPQPNAIVGGILFALTCSSLVFGFMAIFLRFVTRRAGILDSLTASAYGIYIVHYVYNSWLQYGLLQVDLSAIVKASIVFVATLLLSWGTVALLRRIPVVSRVLG